MNILMTGGPVFEHLDQDKIITNKFKGRRMAELADNICALGPEVYYLCSDEGVKPECVTSIIEVDGFTDYRTKVLSMAPKFDAIILGAAVANLIPLSPWKNTRFPSHKFPEGCKFSIDFEVAPKVINAVKGKAPHSILVGFKLLNNVTHQELIDAAFTVRVESGADYIVANDATKLEDKFIVSRSGKVLVAGRDLPSFIVSTLETDYEAK